MNHTAEKSGGRRRVLRKHLRSSRERRVPTANAGAYLRLVPDGIVVGEVDPGDLRVLVLKPYLNFGEPNGPATQQYGEVPGVGRHPDGCGSCLTRRVRADPAEHIPPRGAVDEHHRLGDAGRRRGEGRVFRPLALVARVNVRVHGTQMVSEGDRFADPDPRLREDVPAQIAVLQQLGIAE